MRKFKFIAKIAAASFAVVSLSLAAFAAELKDISEHWSEEYVNYGIEKGYISGYPDGTFLPDNPVTRAEFAKMTNSALGITQSEEAEFFDLEADKWYYPEVGKAVYAGYITGYEDGSFRATNLITRQEAAVILSRLATRPEVVETTDSFADSANIAAWAKDAFDFAYSKKFITGDDLGNLNPLATLTRGQAAKILKGIITSENVVKGNYTVSLVNGVCSETVFTDDVIFDADGEDPTLLLDGCKILGTLYIRTKEDSKVTLEDTKVKNIVADTVHSDITLSDGSSAKKVTLEAPCKLSGEGYKDVILTGEGLSSGTTEIAASPDKVAVKTDAVIKTENISKLSVDSSASLTIQSGTVGKMTVEKGAKDSVITLASGVKVEDLTVEAATAFKGEGKIVKANNKVEGVSYTVKPEKLTGNVSADDKTENNDDEKEPVTDANSFDVMSVSPKANASGIAVTVNPVISYGRKLLDSKGKALTEQYVAQNVEIRKKSPSGTKLYFDVELTSSGRFELNPDGYLEGDTKYYIVIPAGVFTDEDGKKNVKLSYYFTTKESDDDSSSSGSTSSSSSGSTTTGTVRFSLDSGDKDVAVNQAIKITFSAAIKRQSGSAVTNSYLSNTAIELREGTKNGDRVGIVAEINSTKKVVTVEPEQPLKPGVKYYLIVASGTLEFDGGANISSKSVYFTTSDNIGMTSVPRDGATGVALDTEITIEFNSKIYLPDGSRIDDSDLYDIVQLKEKSSTGKDVDFDAELSEDKTKITVIPSGELEAGITYYIVIPAGVIANENETENKKLTSSFKTISAMQPTLSPADGKEDVSLSEEVVIKFAEAVFKDSKGTAIDEAYVTKLIEDKYITLYREGYTTNLLKSGDIIISDDSSTITIVPKKLLGANKVYTLTVKSGKFYNEGKKSNVTATSTFSTPGTGIPEFSIEDGENDIPVDEAIEIQFEDVMKTVNGDALTDSYVQNRVITIYKDNTDGETVAFTAKVSSDKQKLTITPKKDLAGGTTYVVVISAETMVDSNGKENAKHQISFTTEEAVEKGCEITPAYKATNVYLDTDVTLAFNSKLCKKSGEIVTAEYLKNNKIITFKEGNTTTSKDVIFDIEVSSDGKTLTLIPAENLEPNKTYYVKVVKGSLYFFNGSLVDSESFYFKTGEEVSEENTDDGDDEGNDTTEDGGNTDGNGETDGENETQE